MAGPYGGECHQEFETVTLQELKDVLDQKTHGRKGCQKTSINVE